MSLNFDSGWYLSSSPAIAANREASPSQRRVVPFGAGFGRVVWIAGVRFNCSLSAFVNAVKPDFGPIWSLRATVTLLLPSGMLGQAGLASLTVQRCLPLARSEHVRVGPGEFCPEQEDLSRVVHP